MTTTVAGPDGLARCPWAVSNPLETEYHDTEWGVRIHGEAAYFERIALEGFQAGLSWLTILRKREAFRAAFAGFDVDEVAGFDEVDVERLMGNPEIIRNRAKIQSAVTNAAATIALRADGGLEALFNSFAPQREVDFDDTTTPESEALSKELKSRGFHFVGPTTMHATMKAIGLFEPHLVGCFRRGACG